MTKKEGIGIAILILSFLFSSYYFYQESPLSISINNPGGGEITLNLTRREAKILKKFFHRLLIWELFGYTFTGDKPISYTGYKKPFCSLSSLFPSNREIYQGWNCWQKYLPKIPSPKFLFLVEENPWKKDEFLLIIMDQDQVLSTIQQNIDLFEKYLEEPVVSFQKFLKPPQKSSLFKDLLQKNDLLMGILLGFGRENAQYYHEKIQLGDQKEMRSHLVWGASSMEKEMRKLYWKSITGQAIKISDMRRPGFIAKHTEETDKIKKNL